MLENESVETKPIEDVEEKEEFGKSKDEKPLIPVDFYYDFESLVFKPVLSKDANLPGDLITLL